MAVDTINSFLMIHLPPTNMDSIQNTRENTPTPILGNERTPAKRQKKETNTPGLDYCISPTRKIDFGPESYVTPNKLVRCDTLTLDPPPPPRKNCYGDEQKLKRNRIERYRPELLFFPSIESKENNQTTTLLSSSNSPFTLLPRTKLSYNNFPPLKHTNNHLDFRDFYNHHSRAPTRSKIESNTVHVDTSICKDSPLLEYSSN